MAVTLLLWTSRMEYVSVEMLVLIKIREYYRFMVFMVDGGRVYDVPVGGAS